MADNTYPIEQKLASKNGWQTPAEAKAYYGRYSRDNYIVHWWGAPGQVGDHNATVNYILGQASAGNMSVNYVVSNEKITLLVGPDNVSWGSVGGNPTGVNVEHSPYLNDEGYKKAGWLKEQLEQRWGKRLAIVKHSDYMPTACPGTISLARIEAECDKWRKGEYDKAPVPVPPEPTEPVIVSISTVTKYTLNGAKLVNIKDMSAIKSFPLDTPMEIGAMTTWNGNTFLLTVSARDQKRTQGFLIGDLKDTVTPPVVPPVTPTPPVVPPTTDSPTAYDKKQDVVINDIMGLLETISDATDALLIKHKK